MIPTQLNEIAEFLKEEEILNTIKDYFPIQLPKARDLMEVKISS